MISFLVALVVAVAGATYSVSGQAQVTVLGNLSVASSVNSAGQVVGYGASASGAVHAFLWQNGTTTDLGTLPGGSISFASGINNVGQIVGFGDTCCGPPHAFLWQNGAMTDIGPTAGPSFDYTGQPLGINDAGRGGAQLWAQVILPSSGRIG